MRLSACNYAFMMLLTVGLMATVGCSSESSRGPAAGKVDTPSSSYAQRPADVMTEPTAEADMSPGLDSPVLGSKETSAHVDAEETRPERSVAETSPVPPKPGKKELTKRELEAKLRQQELQAGLLTAGSFDDVQNFKLYQEFLNKVLQHDTEERFPRWAIGKFITITVMADGGLPISNAKIEIRKIVADQQQEQPALKTLITGSDGRAILITGEDNLSEHEQVAVRIMAQGTEPVDRIVKLSEPVWNFTLTAIREQNLPQQLDLALVVDTTGSMGDELEYLKAEIDNIAATIKKMFPQVDQRYALIVYRDEGDQYVTRTFNFTPSLSDFRSALSGQSAGGGGDYPEAMHLALEHAGELDWRKDNTARVMFLVGDAPPHQKHARRTLEAGLKLRQQGVRVYPLGASGVAIEAEFIMRAIAFASVGQYLFLTDHSGIGNAHATPHVPQYQVERLDRLMIRMIAGELSGKRLAPTEVIAIEQGSLSNEEGLPPEPIDQQSCLPSPAQVQVASLPTPISISSLLSNLPGWLAFAGLIVSVFLIDAWDKHQRRSHR